jgi:hypothetical protein
MEESKTATSQLCFDISEQTTPHEEGQNFEVADVKIGGHHDSKLGTKTGIFRYADRIDYFLMFFGTLGAAGNGILITLFSLFFGDLVCASFLLIFSWYVMKPRKQVDGFAGDNMQQNHSTSPSLNPANATIGESTALSPQPRFVRSY